MHHKSEKILIVKGSSILSEQLSKIQTTKNYTAFGIVFLSMLILNYSAISTLHLVDNSEFDEVVSYSQSLKQQKIRYFN